MLKITIQTKRRGDNRGGKEGGREGRREYPYRIKVCSNKVKVVCQVGGSTNTSWHTNVHCVKISLQNLTTVGSHLSELQLSESLFNQTHKIMIFIEVCCALNGKCSALVLFHLSEHFSHPNTPNTP